MKFEKIRTAADRRLALKKRGYTTSVDLKPGDVLFVTEKLDGFNASFDTEGRVYSRSGELPKDMTHHQKLIPFRDMITKDVIQAVQEAPCLTGSGRYQVFGEFMVTDRIVPYKEQVYGTHYLFDVYDVVAGKYLGARVAEQLCRYLNERGFQKFLPLHVLERAYVFESYEALESYVYGLREQSKYGRDGIMEGCVVSSETGVRVKIVNKDFKETQRTVTNEKAHTKAVQWLNGYLTQNRVTKIVKNLITEGQIVPGASDYFVGGLSVAVTEVWKDIKEEAMELPVFRGNDEKNVFNKIEAKVRLTMRDEL